MYAEYEDAQAYPVFVPFHTPQYVQRFLYLYLSNKAYYKIDTHSHATGVIAVEQRFSNCGPRTTSGPRVLPLWSF